MQAVFARLRLGAAHDVPLCICNRGFCYEFGCGVEKDEAAALRCYQRAAELGSTVAQISMGHAHLHGKFGLARDRERALSYYKSSAALGNTDAVNELERLGA